MWTLVALATAYFVAVCAWVTWDSLRDPVQPSRSGWAMSCHAAGGRWVSVTLDKDGDTKLWACVDDAGRHVRLTEMK